MTAPFFKDDLYSLGEFIDDHQDEIQETLYSLQDLCKKDERFSLLAAEVVLLLKEAAHKTELAALKLSDASFNYFGGEECI